MTIPYGKQDITDIDILAVTKILKSEFITQGDTVPQFEKRLSQVVAATAVNSATSALHTPVWRLMLHKVI